MPWNNQNGGGGWKGGGGAPWGQGPQGGSGGQQPDLEELLKRSQDKFRQALPGGGGGLLWLLVIVVAVGVWVLNSFHVIQPDERGVVLRFGKYQGTISQGLKFVIWPMDTLTKVKFESENKQNFGSNDDGVMLAGDQNLLDIRFTVLWKIQDARKYLFNTQDPESLVRLVADSAMREIAGRTAADKMRTVGRLEAQNQVQELMQRALDRYDAGIIIRAVRLEKADPPREVRDAFEDVQKAKQDQDKFIEEAQQDKNKWLGEAKGRVSKLTEGAKAYKSKVVAEADGEAQRFISVYDQYAKAKDVTRKRLYLETLESVLSKTNKVIIEQGGKSGVVPYLPLPELTNRTRGGQQ